MVVCDGLTGLPDAIAAVWPQTITQTCVVHLLRNSFRYAGRQHYDAIAKALRPIYTAPTEAAAMKRFLEFAEVLGRALPGDRAVVGERVGGVRAVPELRRRDPEDRVHHERDLGVWIKGSVGALLPRRTLKAASPDSERY